MNGHKAPFDWHADLTEPVPCWSRDWNPPLAWSQEVLDYPAEEPVLTTRLGTSSWTLPRLEIQVWLMIVVLVMAAVVIAVTVASAITGVAS